MQWVFQHLFFFFFFPFPFKEDCVGALWAEEPIFGDFSSQKLLLSLCGISTVSQENKDVEEDGFESR